MLAPRRVQIRSCCLSLPAAVLIFTLPDSCELAFTDDVMAEKELELSNEAIVSHNGIF